MKEKILKILQQIQELRDKEVNPDGVLDPEVRFEIDKLISIAIALALWL